MHACACTEWWKGMGCRERVLAGWGGSCARRPWEGAWLSWGASASACLLGRRQFSGLSVMSLSSSSARQSRSPSVRLGWAGLPKVEQSPPAPVGLRLCELPQGAGGGRSCLQRGVLTWVGHAALDGRQVLPLPLLHLLLHPLDLGRVQRPEAALAGGAPALVLHLLEALVQGEVVADRVLPAVGSRLQGRRGGSGPAALLAGPHLQEGGGSSCGRRKGQPEWPLLCPAQGRSELTRESV